jgi:hypothetical protein
MTPSSSYDLKPQAQCQNLNELQARVAMIGEAFNV